MRRHRPLLIGRVLALAWAAVLAAPAFPLVPPGGVIARAQISLPSPADELRVEWDLDRNRRGDLRLGGYVYNSRAGYYASNVRLRVTGTDRSGRAVVDTTVTVHGDVPPQGRSYFELRVASLEPTYRVTVIHVDFRSYGIGG